MQAVTTTKAIDLERLLGKIQALLQG